MNRDSKALPSGGRSGCPPVKRVGREALAPQKGFFLLHDSRTFHQKSVVWLVVTLSFLSDAPGQ